MELDADTSKLDKAIEESEDAVKNLGKTGQSVVGALDQLTGGLASRFVQARAGIGQLIKGLNLTKVAIASTGIGLLVIALGSLVAYFTQSKRGSELLAQAMAGLKAVFGVITDLAISLGEGIVNAFQNPKQALTDFADLIKQNVQDKINGILDTLGLLGSAAKKLFEGDFSGALEDAGKAATTFVKEVSPVGDIIKIGEAAAEKFGEVAEAVSLAAVKAAALEKAQQKLADQQRETLVLTAKERAEIKALNLVAEDTTKSIEDRIAAAEQAGEKERALFERRRAEAEEALRIRREQNELSESSAEDLQAEAELEAAVYALQQESLELQTTLQNKLNTLKAEGVRITEEQLAAEQAVLDKQRELQNELAQLDETETERAVREAEERYEKRLELAGENAELQKQVEEQYQAELTAIEDKAAADRKAIQDKARAQEAAAEEKAIADQLQREAELQDARKNLVANTLSAFNSLNEIFAKDDERSAKRAFTISKALGIADASIKTGQAVVDALAKDGVPGVPGSRFAAAAAAGLAGAAQIASIARQQFGGAAQPAGVPTGPTGEGGSVPSVPNFEAGAFRSYVLVSDVSTSLQAQQKVEEQSLLL